VNPPSEDIKDILEAHSSLALTFAADLFVSEMPAEPDLCVCVYDTGGYPGEPNYIYERPTIQVKVRGGRGAYRTAHSLAQSIRDVLNGLNGVEVNDAVYVGIWMEGDVIALGYDENHRPMLTLNMRIHRTDAP
jgi:hypothetical protein